MSMSLSGDTIAHLPAVEAELNYLAPIAEKPRSYAYDPPSGTPRSNILPDPHLAAIRSARPIARQVSLDEQGFAIVSHHSAVGDFFDGEEVRRVYYAEAEAALKQATGADRVVIFDHTTRRHIPGAEDRRGGLRQPATRVHVDQTVTSGPQRVCDVVPEEAEKLLRGRVQIINLWRPIKGPVEDAPIALCDAQSVGAADLVATDLVYRDRTGEIYSVVHNPAHRWYYVPKMNVDEALLIKCYDSKTDGRARFTPHTAFADPTTPPGAPGRESIEIRSLVFHDA
jgi:hypothetical protein